MKLKVEAAFLSEAIDLTGTKVVSAVSLNKEKYPAIKMELHELGLLVSYPGTGDKQMKHTIVPLAKCRNIIVSFEEKPSGLKAAS